MASTLRKNLEDQVTCAICQEHFTDPRLLSCLHTYCKKCLADLVQAAARNGEVTCPECRQVVQIPPGGVDHLKVNFQMNNLISLLAVSSLEEQDTNPKVLLCENCTSNDEAKGRCVDCCTFMCEFCINTHKRFRETQDHKLMTLDEVKKHGTPVLSQQPKCAKHKGEVMKLYCESCKQLICRDCTIIDHREHCYQFIDDVAQQHKKALKAALEDAIDASSEMEKTKKLVEDMKTKVTAHCVNVEKEVEEVIKIEIEFLKQKEVNLKAEARKLSDERIQILIKQEQELNSKLKNLNGSIQFTQGILQDDNNVAILSVSSDANDRLSNLVQEMRWLNKQPCRQDDFNFHGNQQNIENSIENSLSINDETNLAKAKGHLQIQTNPNLYPNINTNFNANPIPYLANNCYGPNPFFVMNQHQAEAVNPLQVNPLW